MEGAGRREPRCTGWGSQTAKGPHTQGLSSGSSRLPDDKRRRCVFRRLTTLSSACQVPGEERRKRMGADGSRWPLQQDSPGIGHGG